MITITLKKLDIYFEKDIKIYKNWNNWTATLNGNLIGSNFKKTLLKDI